MKRIYQLLEEDEPIVLLEVKSTSSSVTEGKMELDVKQSAEDGYQDKLGEWDDTSELINLIISDITAKGYDVERIFVENISVI